MFNIFSLLGLIAGLICLSVAVAVFKVLPGAAIYLVIMALCWLGMAFYVKGRIFA